MMRETSEAIRACLRGFEPSEEQWRAISHEPIPVAIIAGAGAGKTAIMAARMVSMVESGLYRPSQILALTFTNKAARELEERIIAAFEVLDPPPPDHPLVATYNSFADRLVREHGVRIGIDREVGLLSEAQKWQLLLEEFGNLDPFEDIESRSMATVVRNALGLADQCANHLVTPEQIIEEDRRIVEEGTQFDAEIVRASKQRIELAKVVRAYLEAKRRARRIDFGDQVTKAVEILERFPDVAAELRETFPALLLDEYQDTNVAQRKLLQIIAPHGYNVTAVGDARQNIFQWRGSTLFNLIDFPTKHFLREAGRQHDYLSLSRNYRSGSKILAVANRIIDQIPPARRPGLPLLAETANQQGEVVAKVFSDQYAEAGYIASEIERLHGEPIGPGRPPTKWSDFAILVRRRSHIMPIYLALKELDIPVEVVGLGGLLQVPEVVDTVAWLRLLADPGPAGNRWLARILLGPRFRVHYRDLALLARWAADHNVELKEAKKTTHTAAPGSIVLNETELDPEDVAFSLTEALEHLAEIEAMPPQARARLERVRTEIAALRPASTGPLLELVQKVIGLAGISEALDASPRQDAVASKSNLTNFLGTVANFAPVSGEASLVAFLAYLDAAEDAEETLELATPALSDSAKLMTVHQAKGLEFEVVFVPSVAARTNEHGEYVDSVFPDIRTSSPMTSYSQLPHGVREDAEHLPNPWTTDRSGAVVPKKKAPYKKELSERAIEDERRLFYVAVTRAKQRLVVSAAWWYERMRSVRGPSMFFNEVASAPETTRLPDDEQTDENPLDQLLQQRAFWPKPDPRTIRDDSLFESAYPEVVESLSRGDLTQSDLFDLLPEADREEAEALIQQHREQLDVLKRASVASAEQPAESRLPASLSATRAVDLAAGAVDLRQVTRPLPERPSSARRIGTEIHRWIEEQARGLTGLADEEDLESPGAHVEASKLAELKKRYDEMGFRTRTFAQLDSGEPMAEVPFVIKLGDRLVRGRIDAVYREADGSLEIVDFKTGAKTQTPQVDQLAVYAGALERLGIDFDRVTLTYAYLDLGEQTSRTLDRREALESLDSLGRQLSNL